jgi:hypothetical protein
MAVVEKQNRLKASTIAEVAIALVIISICFVITGRVIISSTSSSTRFGAVKDQTEFQSKLLEALQKDTLFQGPWLNNSSELIEEKSQENLIQKTSYKLKSGNQTLWEQELHTK